MFLRYLYNELVDLNLVCNQREVGKYLNKTRSYLSSALSKNRDVSVSSLLYLTAKLDEIEESTTEVLTTERDAAEKQALIEGLESIKDLNNKCWEKIWEKTLTEK